MRSGNSRGVAIEKAKPWAAVAMVAVSWILWVRTADPERPERAPDWSMKSGHMSEAGCEKAIKDSVQRFPVKPFKSPNGWYVMRVGHKLWWWDPSKESRGESHTVSFLCFRGDFDPNQPQR